MSTATLDISRAEAIRGWMSPAELRWLAGMASRCRRIVEVGSFAGRSARAMADNLFDGGVLYCIDPSDPRSPGFTRLPGGDPVTTIEQGDAIHAELLANLDDLKHRVIVLRVSSLKAAEMMTLADYDPFDLVFLDGDHAAGAVAADIDAWLPLVAYGGYIAGHDYYNDGQTHPGVREAVDAHVPGCQRAAGSIWYAQVGA